MLRYAARLPYEEAADVLEDSTHVKVSAKEIELIAAEEGERIREAERADLEHFYEEEGWVEEEAKAKNKKPELICIEVDGTIVNSRENEGGMEGKIAVIYEGKQRIGKHRWRLVSRSYVGTYYDIDTLGRMAYRRAFRKGIEQAILVIVKGDGAKWIKSFWRRYIPQAIFVLDWWHLCKELWKALGKAVELGDRRRERLRQRLKGALWRGKVDRVLWALRIVQAYLKDEEAQEAIGSLAGYIDDNREGIRYPELEELGVNIGTGPVEKSIDLTICRRQKQRGMSWLRDKADRLLALRLMLLNGTWDDYWSKRKNLALAA
jgi:hypothetical protein